MEKRKKNIAITATFRIGIKPAKLTIRPSACVRGVVPDPGVSGASSFGLEVRTDRLCSDPGRSTQCEVYRTWCEYTGCGEGKRAGGGEYGVVKYVVVNWRSCNEIGAVADARAS